ncbi:MAG TPA: NAD(P)H-dependent oxidoreductase, partial [Brevibacterium sp.]|nr:NAD(P)H-dependent oxidoreductase [Brevibacterium sp.]
LTERMLASAQAALEAAGASVRTTHLNVRHLAKALTDLTVSGFPAPELEDAFAAVSRASAVITVAPVYKGAPAGIHTLFWQLVDDASLAGTPVLLGATGGTPRHSLAIESTLRPMVSYLKGYALPTAVFAATDDWAGGAQSGLDARIQDATAQLAELTLALNPGAVASGAAEAAPAEAPVGPAEESPRVTRTQGLEGTSAADGFNRSIPYAGPAEESGKSAITPSGLGERARAQRGRDEFDPEQITPFADLLGP